MVVEQTDLSGTLSQAQAANATTLENIHLEFPSVVQLWR